MKLYYEFDQDIMCIVEGNKIYKFVGEFTDDKTREFVKEFYKFNAWYEAYNHPEYLDDFELIGTI